MLESVIVRMASVQISGLINADMFLSVEEKGSPCLQVLAECSCVFDPRERLGLEFGVPLVESREEFTREPLTGSCSAVVEL